MRVTLMGKLSVPCYPWAENLAESGYDFSFLNTHMSRQGGPLSDRLAREYSVEPYNLYQEHTFPYGARSRLEILAYHYGLLRRHPTHWDKTVARLEDYAAKAKPDLLFLWWGYDLAYEIYLMKYILKWDIPIVHVMNTFPADTQGLGWGKIELKFYRLFHDKIAGRIFYSDEMKQYYERKVGKAPRSLTMVEPYLRRHYWTPGREPKYVLERLDDNPHIIFIGRTDFSSRRGQRKDDLRKDLARLEEQKIHVFIMSTDIVEESDFIHFFTRISGEELWDGTFADYVHQFDGILNVYNEFGSKTRYTTGLCTRFAHGFTAGIPTITRTTSTFAANIFAQHQNGLTYSDEAELREKLLNKSYMDNIRQHAENNIDVFGYELFQEDVVNLIGECASVAS